MGEMLKNRIDELKKEQFTYKPASLQFSQEQLIINTEPDCVSEGSLIVRSLDGTKVNGSVYTSHWRFWCVQTEFHGSVAELLYRFDSTGMRSGDTICGHLSIVSDAGEYRIPFAATAEMHMVTTSEGKLRSVSSFLTLANLDTELAFQAFSQPSFIQTLKNDDVKYLRWYEGFVKNGITYEAMTGFLGITGEYHEPAAQKSLRAELKQAYNRQNIDYAKREYRRKIVRLSELYLRFRGMKLPVQQWAKSTRETLDELSEYGVHADLFYMMGVHTLLIEGETDQARARLNAYVDSHYDLQSNQELYGYYLYLCAMLRRSSSFLVQACQRIRVLYARRPQSILLLWVLLMMDEELLNDYVEKIRLMEEQYERGVHSPFIYIEAAMLYRQDPLLIGELSDYEMQVLFFAQRFELISPEMMKRIASLSMHNKEFSPMLFQLLVNCYEQYPDRTTVHAICTLLIKGNKTGEEYFVWYARGVEHDLRITRLYDFFLYSVKEDMDQPLGEGVLQYLRYNQDIDYRKKSFLFANLYKFQSMYPELYEQYYQDMVDFTVYQLGKGRINRHLILLYQNLVDRRFVGSRTAYAIIDYIFSYWLSDIPKQYTAVVVREPAFSTEHVIPVVDQEAVVPVYSTDACVYYQTADGRRVGIPDIYEQNRWFLKEELLGACEQYCPNHPAILLGRGERLVSDPGEQWKSTALELMEMPALSESFRQELMQQLMQHFYDEYDLDSMSWCLDNVDLYKMPEEYRIPDVERLILQGDYARAGEYVFRCGCEGIDPKLLVRLCSRLIGLAEFAWEERLIAVCLSVFEQGKYDEVMLTYLLEYGAGDTACLLRLWEAGQQFGLDTYLIEERILRQALYSGFFQSKLYQVFEEYYRRPGSSELVLAFLTALSGEVLMKGLTADRRLFVWIGKELSRGEELNRTCRLAWLYGLSRFPELSEHDQTRAERILSEFTKRGSYFPFYRNLPAGVCADGLFGEKEYIEYRTSPAARVFCYFRNGETADGLCGEEMEQPYPGVFVRECTVFEGDEWPYYLVEFCGGEARLVKNGIIRRTSAAGSENSRYQKLNQVLTAAEADRETLLENYIKEQYMAEQLFRAKVF